MSMTDQVLLLAGLACCALIVARVGDARILALICGLCLLAVLLTAVTP